MTMITDLVRTLYRYSTWATARILDAAVRLSPEQLAAPSGASYSSVRETLVHIMGAQSSKASHDPLSLHPVLEVAGEPFEREQDDPAVLTRRLAVPGRVVTPGGQK